METIRLIIEGIPPLSTNETVKFNRNGKYYKSTKKAEFQKEIDLQCLKYADDLAAFKRNFNKKTEFISVFYQIRIPEEKFYNKNGSMKLTRKDLDNHFKALQDRVFKNLGIDDVYILDLVADLRPDKDYKTAITINKLTRDF
jgi:Holliday junction resolvase RusA-like endonuclease